MVSINEYWDKFCKDGKIESYLSYKENQYKQESAINGTKSTYDRLSDNKGKEYR